MAHLNRSAHAEHRWKDDHPFNLSGVKAVLSRFTISDKQMRLTHESFTLFTTTKNTLNGDNGKLFKVYIQLT